MRTLTEIHAEALDCELSMANAISHKVIAHHTRRLAALRAEWRQVAAAGDPAKGTRPEAEADAKARITEALAVL